MKKITKFSLLVSIIVSLFLQIPSIAKNHKVKVSSTSSITATISGNLTLLAKHKHFPSDLAELYSGRNQAVKFSKKGKKMHVDGSYSGGDIVTIEEDTAQGVIAYQFDIPVIKSILETFSSTVKKKSSKAGTITARFGSITKTISIVQVVTSRQGNQAKVTGSFAKKSAKGRFTLNFTFE